MKTINKEKRSELRKIVCKGLGGIGYDAEESFTKLWIAGCEKAREDTEQSMKAYRILRDYSDRLVLADEMIEKINEKGFEEETPIPFSDHFDAMIYCDAEDLMVKCRIFLKKEDAENLDERDVNAIKTAAESVVAAVCRCADGLFEYFNDSTITGEGLYEKLHDACANTADETFEMIFASCH